MKEATTTTETMGLIATTGPAMLGLVMTGPPLPAVRQRYFVVALLSAISCLTKPPVQIDAALKEESMWEALARKVFTWADEELRFAHCLSAPLPTLGRKFFKASTAPSARSQAEPSRPRKKAKLGHATPQLASMSGSPLASGSAHGLTHLAFDSAPVAFGLPTSSAAVDPALPPSEKPKPAIPLNDSAASGPQRRKNGKPQHRSKSNRAQCANFVDEKRAKRAQEQAEAAAKRLAADLPFDIVGMQPERRNKLFDAVREVKTHLVATDLAHESTAFKQRVTEQGNHAEGVPGPSAGKVLFGELHPEVHQRVHELLEDGSTYICLGTDK